MGNGQLPADFDEVKQAKQEGSEKKAADEGNFKGNGRLPADCDEIKQAKQEGSEKKATDDGNFDGVRQAAYRLRRD